MITLFTVKGRGINAFKYACLFFLFISLCLTLGFNPTLANEKSAKQMIFKSSVGDKEIKEKLDLVKFNHEFLKRVEAKVVEQRHHEVFQQKIRDYPAGKKIAAFLKALAHSEAKGIKAKEWFKSFSKQKKAILNSTTGGSITGTVTVEGEVVFDGIEVLAFDTFGFFAGAGFVDAFSGGIYTITDLPAGDYYVVTKSPFVNEFFDDVRLDFFRNWRNANLVKVTDGQPTNAVNFDLLRGAKVTGRIFEADGVTPIAFMPVNFEINRAVDPDFLYGPFAATGQNGEYEINIPSTGHFKIKAMVPGYKPEYYNDKPDFASADIITVATLNDSIPNIHFSLEEEIVVVEEGAHIMGKVVFQDTIPVPLSLVFAFNTKDTTIAGLSLASDDGFYEVSPLDAGDYILYSNDYLGFVLGLFGLSTGLPPLQGEYYDNAPTSDLATPVTVAALDTAFGINFTLEMGGGIMGNITDSNGAALDSVLVVAVKNFSDTGVGKYFTDDIDFGIAFSDSAGNYAIYGLSSGNYVLRTVSLLDSALLSKNIIDVYYPDVQSIFDFKKATPVVVNSPTPTTGIDFVLPIGGTLSGHFFELDGSTPVMEQAVALAFNADTGYPEIAIGVSDTSDGSFTLAPLPSGNFKVLGVVIGDIFNGDNGPLNLGPLSQINSGFFELAQEENVIYLPQFYDQKTFATADIVTVTAPNDRPGVDFKMIRAAMIEGVVNLPSGNPVGADSLEATLVVAYDADSLVARGGAETKFAGGYRIMGLPPGNYKVEALTATQGYAATYHGGGNSFNDVNSTVVTLAPGEKKSTNINLDTGNGMISGMVYNFDGSLPLRFVMVIAYDLTGHAVSMGVSGFDVTTGIHLPSPGEYRIPGLVAGDYYVRTFSLFQIFMFLDQLDLGGELGGDPLTILFGLLFGGGEDLLDQIDIQLFADNWYKDQPVDLNLNNIDLFSLIFGLIMSEGDPGFLLPFFDSVPSTATKVTVTSPGMTSGIDFHLPNLTDLLVSVDEGSEIDVLPESFNLSQNYPNPFNPSTVINYSVPKTAHIQLRIFNVIGQRIKTLFDGIKEAGDYTTRWNGLNDNGQQIAAGIYFLRLETENTAISRKMLLVK